MLDSEHRILFDVTTIGCYLGPRVNECTQTTDKLWIAMRIRLEDG